LTGTQQVLVTAPATATIAGKAVPGGALTGSLGVTGASYGLVQADFDKSGVAFINVTSGTVGPSTISAQVVGGSAAATTVLSFATAGGTGQVADSSISSTKIDGTTAASGTNAIGSAGGISLTGNGTAISAALTSASFTVGSQTASAVIPVRVGQTYTNSTTYQVGLLGAVVTSALYTDLAVTVGSTATTATSYVGFYNATTARYYASVSVPAVLSLGSDYNYNALTVDVGTGSGFSGSATVISGAASTATTLTLATPSAASVLSAPGATITATAKCVDNFGAAKSNVVITPAFSAASRNYGLFNMTTQVTSATGYVTISWTDASTSTTNLTDVLNLTGCGDLSSALTVTYNSTSGFGVDKVTWKSGGGYADALSYAGATKTAIGTGDGGAAASLTFKVVDASGNPIAGVPVTFSVDTVNSSAVIKKTSTSDSSLQYTATDGTASTSVYAYKPGKATVTATAGGKTVTGYITFVNPNTNADARNITATAKDGVISVKVTDRFGNGVNGVSVTLTRVGTGFFGNGVSTLTQAVDENGTLDVMWAGGTATVTAKLTTASDQSQAPAGQYDNTAGDTYTAAVAGLTTGYGASFAPAGNWTTTVDAVASTASSDSVDAANEATDAANAATDAANAAAEAADAATAAAQDAQAAVAALASQVADLISGIKAQITALTNLVIKIQKKVKA